MSSLNCDRHCDRNRDLLQFFTLFKIKKNMRGKAFQFKPCWKSSAVYFRCIYKCLNHSMPFHCVLSCCLYITSLCCVYKNQQEPEGFQCGVSACSYCGALQRLSLNSERTRGKNKTLAWLIVEILVSCLMALLFGQRCPKLLEGRAG